MTGRQDGIFDEGNVAADFQRSRWPLPMAWLGSVDCGFSVNGEVKFPNGERWKMWVYSWKLIYDSKVGL